MPPPLRSQAGEPPLGPGLLPEGPNCTFSPPPGALPLPSRQTQGTASSRLFGLGQVIDYHFRGHIIHPLCPSAHSALLEAPSARLKRTGRSHPSPYRTMSRRPRGAWPPGPHRAELLVARAVPPAALGKQEGYRVSGRARPRAAPLQAALAQGWGNHGPSAEVPLPGSTVALLRSGGPPEGLPAGFTGPRKRWLQSRPLRASPGASCREVKCRAL